MISSTITHVPGTTPPIPQLDVSCDHTDRLDFEVSRQARGDVLYVHMNGVSILRVCGIDPLLGLSKFDRRLVDERFDEPPPGYGRRGEDRHPEDRQVQRANGWTPPPAPRVDVVYEAARKAARTFRAYAEIHRDKGNEDKAKANELEAILLEEALAMEGA